jgi:hypothetical protein
LERIDSELEAERNEYHSYLLNVEVLCAFGERFLLRLWLGLGPRAVLLEKMKTHEEFGAKW